MDRIVIVSNRVPKPEAGEIEAGGLAIGLRAVLEQTGGLWFGWSGRISEAPNRTPSLQHPASFTLATIDLCEREYAGYYAGFANRSLWPLLHGRVDLMRFDTAEWATYRSVNDTFACNLVSLLRPQDRVWVHDYHLILLGQSLRRVGVDAPLGFFLHVPFPAPDVLSALPCHEDLIRALSVYDLVGFQTENDLHNFHEFVIQRLGGSVSDAGTVQVCGQQFRTGTFPIGIDAERFSALAESREVEKLCRHMQPCFGHSLGIVGVDRLDYTKGLLHRLRAFERLLETAPNCHRRAFLVQIAAPSRIAVPEYSDLRRELEALSGRINARHADLDWTPVRFLNRAIAPARIAGLFRLSRVGLVTPLSDGMNLVAKEYVAAQLADDPGVLVLSRFAGAAEQLKAALVVNPHDVDGMARALRDALEMPLEERRERWTEMMTGLRTHDIQDWQKRFVHQLGKARNFRQRLSMSNQGSTSKTWPFMDGLFGDDEQAMTVPDPVCGGRVPINQGAAQEDHGGFAYFFCSARCHDLFAADPDRYAGPKSPRVEQGGGTASRPGERG